MEKKPITIALSYAAWSFIDDNFKNNCWVSWDFPDYVVRLELDPTIDDGVILRHDGRRMETKLIMEYTLPASSLPKDITQLLNLSYSEAIRCYENACFLACIALCGRTIETALGSFYEKTVGVHPSQESSPPGLNAIINRLKRDGFVFPAGLKEHMETIAKHRNMAVHGNLVIPTEDETRSVVYLTRNVLNNLAKH